jgi:predicted metal-dependent hydrolase
MSNPPPYSVRVSTRAKRLQLKVLPPGKVEVVVPKRVSLKHVPAFVAEHGHWLQRQLAQMTAMYGSQPLLPEVIELPAVAEQWQVDYLQVGRGRVTQAAGRLRVSAPNERQACQRLQRWLQQHARELLPPRLEAVAQQVGLSFNRVTVRAQKSRWGSCSTQKNINLNRALLFVSPAALRYLMIHELCHTVHLNHSPRYWRLVERLMPDYRDHEAELRRAMQAIPRWALPGFYD